MAGRPKHWFTIDLDNIDYTVDEILKACKTPKVREGFQNLIIRLKDSLFEKSDSYSQTDEFNSFQFIEMLSSESENDVAFILDNIWVQLGAEQQMCSLYQFLEDMSLCDLPPAKRKSKTKNVQRKKVHKKSKKNLID